MGSGFLGYPPSTLMLDVVVSALVLVVPILLFSLYLVKVRKNYTAHRNVQLLLAVVLLIAVVLFEIDIRLHGGWEKIVDQPAGRLTPERMATIRQTLYVHLVFAFSTPVLWGVTIAGALRRFANPPVPAPHSGVHKVLGWASVIDLTLTSVTGLVFYYFAFVVK